MPWVQHVVTLEELIGPQLFNSKCNRVLIVGDNGAWRFSVKLDEKIKYGEHCWCSLVNHNRDSSEQHPEVGVCDSEYSHSESPGVVSHISKEAVRDVERNKVSKPNVVVTDPNRSQHKYSWVLVARLRTPFNAISVVILDQPWAQACCLTLNSLVISLDIFSIIPLFIFQSDIETIDFFLGLRCELSDPECATSFPPSITQQYIRSFTSSSS